MSGDFQTEHQDLRPNLLRTKWAVIGQLPARLGRFFPDLSFYRDFRKSCTPAWQFPLPLLFRLCCRPKPAQLQGRTEHWLKETVSQPSVAASPPSKRKGSARWGPGFAAALVDFRAVCSTAEFLCQLRHSPQRPAPPPLVRSAHPPGSSGNSGARCGASTPKRNCANSPARIASRARRMVSR